MLLARYPRAGEVKTRVASEIGDEAALELHDRLTRAALERLMPLQACGDALVEVRTDAAFVPAASEWLAPATPRRARPRFRYQGDGDLGAKLVFAFSEAFTRQAPAALVVGADCPSLETSDLREALELLSAGADVVLGPACDGGYWLVALTRESATRAAPLFADIDWGTGEVLAQTLAAASDAGLRVELLRELPDCDVPADVPAATAILDAEAASATAPASVVIPALDDEALVGTAVSAALAGGAAEVIVVDGGSRDATMDAARAAGARVLGSPRGRARQMNAGAEEACGAIVVFTHADTVLPAGFAAAAREALSRPAAVAAAFDFAVPAGAAHARLIAAIGQARWRMTRVPYGDQCLGMRTATFRRLGGFADLPTMEDVEIAARLRRLGRIERIAMPAVTSARVWEEHGLVRPTLVNAIGIAAFRAGVDPERIATWRRLIARG